MQSVVVLQLFSREQDLKKNKSPIVLRGAPMSSIFYCFKSVIFSHTVIDCNFTVHLAEISLASGVQLLSL